MRSRWVRENSSRYSGLLFLNLMLSEPSFSWEEMLTPPAIAIRSYQPSSGWITTGSPMSITATKLLSPSSNLARTGLVPSWPWLGLRQQATRRCSGECLDRRVSRENSERVICYLKGAASSRTMSPLSITLIWIQGSASTAETKIVNIIGSWPLMEQDDRLLSPGRLLAPPDDLFLLEALEDSLAPLKAKLGCKSRREFFGAHPVSLTRSLLKNMRQNPLEYFVCEKSDGVRFIMVVLTDGNVLLTSRKAGAHGMQFFQINCRVQLPALTEGRDLVLVYEVFDGELVDQQGQLKYLIFDTMVHMSRIVSQDSYFTRLYYAEGFLRMQKGLSSLLAGSALEQQANMRAQSMAAYPKITLLLKDFFRFSMTGFVLSNYIPRLPHKNDGLIFTKEKWAYSAGTCPQLMKWKPGDMNTIDFMAVPNDKLDYQSAGVRVFDLYVKERSAQLQEYADVFFDFMVLCLAQAEQLILVLEKVQQSSEQPTPGLICECARAQLSNPRVRQTVQGLKALSPQQLLQKTMLTQFSTEKTQLDQVRLARGRAWGWRPAKPRPDKSLPNNLRVAVNVIQTLVQDIRNSQFQ